MKHHRIKHHHRKKPMLEEDEEGVKVASGDYNAKISNTQQQQFSTSTPFTLNDDDIHDFYNSHPVGISYNTKIKNSTQDYYNQHTTREGGLSSTRIRPMEEAHDDSNFSRLSDIYTSDFGHKFRIVERDKDGNPTAIREMKENAYTNFILGDRVYRARPDGKFIVDDLSDEQKDQVRAFDDGLADVYKTVGNVASGISTAYGAYQGIKAGYEGIKSLVDTYNNIPDEDTYNNIPDEDIEAFVEEELNGEALPTEEELTAAEEQAEEIFAQADEALPTIEEIGQSMVERFSSLYPDYSYSGQNYNEYEQVDYENYDDYEEVDKEDYDEYEEVAADEAEAEPLVAEAEGAAAEAEGVEEAVESASWWEAAVDVVEGVGEVMVELAPLGI